MKISKLSFSSLVFLLAPVALGQQPLTNESIMKLAKAGMSDDVIVGTIGSQPAAYSLGADDLIALKAAGVSDKAIAAMLAKNSGSPASAAAKASEAGPVHEIGVYYKKGSDWQDMEPEVVSFKSGGVLKSMGTYGIVKGDINGHIKGAQSKTALKTPIEILIYTPEGVGATEYQLLRLHTQSDSREFRTVTGGVFHKSGGASRDAVEFEAKKIASRTYSISLSGVKSGEYGILPPASGDGTGSSGRIGKLYSFQVIE